MVDAPSYNHLVWQPDALGSVCFLVAGYLAYVEVAGRGLGRPPRSVEGVIVTVNLAGCVAFGISAVTGFVLPATGLPLNINPYGEFYGKQEPVAGAVLPAPGTYDVVFD